MSAPSRRKTRRCRQCKAYLFRIETDGRGRALEVYAPCVCERRRLAGLCLDCDRPVEGTPGRAVRCAEHKRAANHAARRRYYERKKADLGTSYIHPTTRRSHRRPEYMRRAREHARRKRQDPEWREKRRAYDRMSSKFGHPNREKKLAYMREYNRRPEVVARRQKYDRQRRRAA